MSSGFFRGTRSGRKPTGSAVVADVVSRVNVYGPAVSVAKVPASDIVHIRVVAELIVTPVAALVADATVSVTIVDAAVEADFRTPIAIIPGIPAVVPTPITRSP
jgi:hypothetical protein